MGIATRSAFRASTPVLAGFVASGFIYGLLMEELGYPWYGATCMSLFVHATFSQFLVLPLLAVQAPLWEIALLTFAANSRFFFFGLGLNRVWPQKQSAWLYPWAAMTDESYTLILTAPEADRKILKEYGHWVTGFCHLYWVLGSLLGASLGPLVTHDLSILGFVPRALCVVMVVEQLKAAQSIRPVAVALISGTIAYWLWGPQFLWGGLILAGLVASWDPGCHSSKQGVLSGPL